MAPPTKGKRPTREPGYPRFPEFDEDPIPGAPIVESGNDPFVKSSYVYGLNQSNYDGFVSGKDMVLVMFYDPNDLTSRFYRGRFIQAARTTMRMKSAFAAVDCSKETALCANEGIPNTPTFKLVSLGNTLKTITNVVNFDRLVMHEYVVYTPKFTPPRTEKSRCDR